jgi:hypothetical protein
MQQGPSISTGASGSIEKDKFSHPCPVRKDELGGWIGTEDGAQDGELPVLSLHEGLHKAESSVFT